MHLSPSILLFFRLRPRNLRLLLVAALWFLPVLSPAAVDRWSPTGPQGGDIRLLVAAPSAPNRLLAASENSVFFSGVEGSSWTFAGAGLESEDVRSLAFDPVDSGVAYAGTRGKLYRTADAAHGPWQVLAENLPGLWIAGIAIDPQDPSRIYLAARQAGVLRSTDGGATFTTVNQGLDSLQMDFVILDPRQPRTLYAGGLFAGLHTSTDGGDSWRGITPPTPSGEVRTALLDPTGSPAGGRLFASTGDGLYRSDDGGVSWEPAQVGIESDPVFTLALHPGVTGHLYASILDTATRQEVPVRSTDGGATWSHVENAPNSQGVRAFVPRPFTPGQLLAATERGVFRTTNGGQRWVAAQNGLRAFAVDALAAAGDGDLFFGDRFGSVFRGEGGPGPWQAVASRRFLNGLINDFLGPLATAPSDPQTVYGGLFDALLVSEDGGATWRESAGLPCLEPVTIAVHPADPRRVIVSGFFYQSICGLFGTVTTFHSFDGGETWLELPALDDVFHFVFDPHDGDVLYASRGGLSKSTDGGATFQPADAGLPEGVTFTLAADPARPGRLLAGAAEGLFRSLDGAATWQAVGAGLPAVPLTSLVIDPEVPDRIYAGLAGVGVYLSTDGGVTFQSHSAGLPAEVFTGQLALDGELPNIVYAGTHGRGLYSIATARCTADADTLCLQGGRFQVEVAWQDPFGNQGAGQAQPLTQDTGTFWFFNAANLEMAVKVLDGRALNGHFWVFFGALTDVHYTLRVTDTATGRTVSYENPAGQLASRGDTRAFFDDTGLPGLPVASPLNWETPVATSSATTGGGCTPTPTRLCLNGNRFEVEVHWRDFQERTGSGRSVDLTEDTGAFWFFNEENVEMLIKVLDARTVNGHFWVFYGSLTNVEFTLTVTDRKTGQVRTYRNHGGNFGSRGDTRAF